MGCRGVPTVCGNVERCKGLGSDLRGTSTYAYLFDMQSKIEYLSNKYLVM